MNFKYKKQMFCLSSRKEYIAYYNTISPPQNLSVLSINSKYV